MFYERAIMIPFLEIKLFNLINQPTSEHVNLQSQQIGIVETAAHLIDWRQVLVFCYGTDTAPNHLLSRSGDIRITDMRLKRTIPASRICNILRYVFSDSETSLLFFSHPLLPQTD